MLTWPTDRQDDGVSGPGSASGLPICAEPPSQIRLTDDSIQERLPSLVFRQRQACTSPRHPPSSVPFASMNFLKFVRSFLMA